MNGDGEDSLAVPELSCSLNASNRQTSPGLESGTSVDVFEASQRKYEQARADSGAERLSLERNSHCGPEQLGNERAA